METSATDAVKYNERREVALSRMATTLVNSEEDNLAKISQLEHQILSDPENPELLSVRKEYHLELLQMHTAYVFRDNYEAALELLERVRQNRNFCNRNPNLTFILFKFLYRMKRL